MEATLSNMSDNEEIPVDELVTVSCPLFRQLLNAYSEDAATDDYIYYLGEALRQASGFTTIHDVQDLYDIETTLGYIMTIKTHVELNKID